MEREYEFDFGDDEPTIEAAVFQALGTASVAWDEDGVFNDRLVLQIGGKLIEFIEAHQPPQVVNVTIDGFTEDEI